MGQEKALVTREELEETWSNTVIMGMLTVMVFLLLLPFIQQATVMAQEATAMVARVPVSTQALEPIAGNVGAMWIQLTPRTRPNEFRMIAENSTGAFESMLVGLST